MSSGEIMINGTTYWHKQHGGLVYNSDGREVGAGLVAGARPPLMTTNGSVEALAEVVKRECCLDETELSTTI